MLLAETDRIRDDIPWRHMRIGGEKAVPVFENCVCEEKPVVPLIEIGPANWNSEWLTDPDQQVDESEWETE